MLHQRRRHVILSAQRVRGDEYAICPRGAQRAREICRLCCYVRASDKPQSVERLLFLEAMSDLA
jgi:hypothetical protein